jgi:hypothetical protein
MNATETKNMQRLEELAHKTPQFTNQDATAITGMSYLDVEQGIKEMMAKYHCKLRVTENGDIIYDFEKLERRDAKKFSEYLQEFGEKAWKVFTIIYKFLISAFLVVYFIIFLVLVIAAVVAMSSGKDNRSRNGGGELLSFVFRLFISIFQWRTIMGYNQYYYQTDRYGYQYRHYKEKEDELTKNWKGNQSKKGFVASVFDFVFGPPRYELNPLANLQELSTYLKTHKYVVSTYELIALAGWTKAEAEDFMTFSLTQFNGEAKMTDNGILYGDFNSISRRKTEIDGAPIVYYWDENEADYELNGNSSGRNMGIIAMNGFNLLISFFFLYHSNNPELGNTMLVLGIIPFIFSLSFFLIPFIRYLIILQKRRMQHRINIRKRLIRYIFHEQSGIISLERLTQVANQNKGEKLNKKLIEQMMMDIIRDFDARSEVDENGQIQYHFEPLEEELSEMDRLRDENTGNKNNLGNIVFET